MQLFKAENSGKNKGMSYNKGLEFDSFWTGQVYFVPSPNIHQETTTRNGLSVSNNGNKPAALTHNQLHICPL